MRASEEIFAGIQNFTKINSFFILQISFFIQFSISFKYQNKLKRPFISLSTIYKNPFHSTFPIYFTLYLHFCYLTFCINILKLQRQARKIKCKQFVSAPENLIWEMMMLDAQTSSKIMIIPWEPLTKLAGWFDFGVFTSLFGGGYA